jgi:hypothetical protein
MTKKHEQSTHPRSHPTSFNLTCQPTCVRRKKPETLTPVTRTFPETVPITGLVSEKLTACAVTLVMESSSGGHRVTGPVTDHPIFFRGKIGDIWWYMIHLEEPCIQITQVLKSSKNGEWLENVPKKRDDCQPLTVAVKARWEVHSHLEELPHPASFPWH